MIRKPKLPRGVKPMDFKGEKVSPREMWESLVSNPYRIVFRVEKEIRIYQLGRDGRSAIRVLFDKTLDLGNYAQLDSDREKEVEEFALKALLYAHSQNFNQRERTARSHCFVGEPKPQRHLRKWCPPQSKLF